MKLKSSESNYSLLDKHLLSFGTVLVPEMCVHTIDPSVEGPPSVFAREYAEQLSREFQETPDRVSEGIPQFDVIILGLDADGKAAGLAAPPTMSVAQLLSLLFLFEKHMSCEFPFFAFSPLCSDEESSDTLVVAIPAPLLPPATLDPASSLKLQVRRFSVAPALFHFSLFPS